ncbi:helix-turn-helix domain-containing protein [Anseongella ginsenosidimutans]|uniref:helix-turn-helix domain-containing protein n=1 Tax=Anseongella ginsenosidimutans TaxID=496056 RepID=UPI001CEF9B67|nr:helix-turn-helix transcriptional regulator [Anseongella ginsenosidimutans]
MTSQKIFFCSNLKFLRERKKISQEALAEKLHITRSKLNALENGQTKAPSRRTTWPSQNISASALTAF